MEKLHVAMKFGGGQPRAWVLRRLVLRLRGVVRHLESWSGFGSGLSLSWLGSRVSSAVVCTRLLLFPLLSASRLSHVPLRAVPWLLTPQAFIFDGRNILDHTRLRSIGFEVYAIGKPRPFKDF
jgi:hypothetical protein